MYATNAILAFDAIGGGRIASKILTAMESAGSRRVNNYSMYGSSVHKSEPDGQYTIAMSSLLRGIRGGQCFLNLGELNQGGRIFRADRSVVFTSGVRPL